MGDNSEGNIIIYKGLLIMSTVLKNSTNIAQIILVKEYNFQEAFQEIFRKSINLKVINLPRKCHSHLRIHAHQDTQFLFS